ncbi:hypothetical protein [Falsihalocynthiibacter arcticus]|uniref:Uncharacterized protein n=1 Tax=Falsihalocynthiibacter arcticus TaxID=1579316 RepID=A0A126V4M4_9RHOB|nr:hypothetical protein [Falsihalocynthiibacter arcticus]AML52826.1 hypothetical protein RC74_17575 [Falsihalocynthiibacter arcticus]
MNKRYWGLAVFSVVWVFVIMVFTGISRNISGLEPGPISVTAVLWFLVAYFAFQGNQKSIRITAFTVLMLQAVGGLVLVGLTLSEPTSPSFSYAIGVNSVTIGFNMIPWFAVLIYANSEIKKESVEPHIQQPMVVGPPIKNQNQIMTMSTNSKMMPIPEHSKPRPEINSFPIASTVIEYNSDAEKHWRAVQKLPVEYQTEFLRSLNEEPKQDVKTLSESLLEKHQKELSPFQTEKLNATYAQMLVLGEDAANEFRKAYSILGDTVPVATISQKILNKYENIKGTVIPSGVEKDRIINAVKKDPSISFKRVNEIGVIENCAYVKVRDRYHFGARGEDKFPFNCFVFQSLRDEFKIPLDVEPILIWAPKSDELPHFVDKTFQSNF